MPWFAMTAVVFLLLATSALFVAAEFAVVSSRRSRLAQMAAEGNSLANWLYGVTTDLRRLDAYVATCQVGITLSNLVLGFYGQGRVAEALSGGLDRLGVSQGARASLSGVIVLVVLTALQVVIGELVPKNIGVRRPEGLALATALPMRWASAVLAPFVMVLNGSGGVVLRALGLGDTGQDIHVHRPEEIVMLAQESRAGGLLDPEEQRLLARALRWRELKISQVMVPRTQLLAAPADSSTEAMRALLAGSPHARLLLYGESVDDISGAVHLKDLLCMDSETPPASAVRPPLYVPETAAAAQVFATLQRTRLPVAVVLDEYGGTAGMTTLDDLVEALFGELQDEFDSETADVAVADGGRRLLVRGDVLVRDLDAWLDLYLAPDAGTVGGLVLDHLGHVPALGDTALVDGVALVVERMDGHAVTLVGLDVTPEQVAALRARHG
jgi:putative hemolysin